jgi:hypothetical protein
VVARANRWEAVRGHGSRAIDRRRNAVGTIATRSFRRLPQCAEAVSKNIAASPNRKHTPGLEKKLKPANPAALSSSVVAIRKPNGTISN